MPKETKVTPSEPKDHISLNGDDVINGLSMDEEVTLTVKARLVEEGSRDYEGKPRPTQRFQIASIGKTGSKLNKSIAVAQSKGKGVAG